MTGAASHRTGLSRRESIGLAVLFALALAVRLCYAIHLGDHWVSMDEGDYCEHAINVLRGRGLGLLFSLDFPTHDVFRAYRMPLYPLFLAGIFKMWGINFLVPRLIQAALGALACVLLYVFARQLFGRNVAALAGAVSIVYPAFIIYSGRLLTEGLFIPLFLASLCLTVHAVQRRSAWTMALAGLAWGAVILARAQLVTMGMAAGMSVLLARSWEPSWKRRVALAAVLGITTLLTLSPWVIRNAMLFHRFVPLTSQSGSSFGILNRADSATGLWYPKEPHWLAEHWRLRHLQEVERSRALRREGQAFVREHPGQYLRFMWNRFVQFWGLKPDYWKSWAHAGARFTLYAIAMAGVLVAWRRGMPLWWIGLLLTVGCLFPVLAIGNGDTRIRMPVEPLLLLYAAVAAAALTRGAIEPAPVAGFPRRWAGAMAGFVPLLLLPGVMASPKSTDRPFDYADYVLTGRPASASARPDRVEELPAVRELSATRRSFDDPMGHIVGRRVRWEGGLYYNMRKPDELRKSFSERSVFLVNLNLTPRTFGEEIIVVTYDGQLPSGLTYEEPLRGIGRIVGVWMCTQHESPRSHNVLVVKADWVERAG